MWQKYTLAILAQEGGIYYIFCYTYKNSMLEASYEFTNNYYYGCDRGRQV